MKRSIIFMTLISSCLVQASFIADSLSQYRGNRAFQANDFKKAQSEYSQILDNDPYDPQANYNVGVALYKQNKYEESMPYFSRASSSAGKNNVLQEQALFNQGNAYAQLKQLDEALQSYEKVLEINPKNEQAAQNADLIKKMKQQPPEQQQDQDDKPDDQKDNQQKNKNEKQKQNKNDSDKKNPGSNDQKSDDQRSDDQRSDDQDSSDQGSQNNKSNDQKLKDQKENQSSNGKNGQNPEEDLNFDISGEHSKGNDTQKDQKTEPHKNHNNSLQKSEEQQDNSSGQDKKNISELQDELAEQVETKPEDDERLDKRSALVMQKMSEHEDNLQKQILKMNVSKPGAAKYGQKNW